MMSSQKTQTVTVSNSLNPDQALFFVGPDQGPNCLQRLSEDDTSRQGVNGHRLNLVDTIFIVLHVSKAIYVLTNIRVKRAMCIKKLFWPPYEEAILAPPMRPKNKSCFSLVSY